MNVLLISGSDHKYGTGVMTKNIITEYKNSFQDINLIVLTNKNGEINNLCNKYNIKNFTLKYKYHVRTQDKSFLFIFFKKIYNIMNDFFSLIVLLLKIDIKTIDLIHTNHNRILFGCFISKLFRIKHVMSLREIFHIKLLFNKQIYFLNKHVDKFISVSNCVKTSWDNNGLDNKKNIVVYDGIKFNGSVNNKTFSDKCIKLIQVANIEYNKRQLTALKAINEIYLNYNYNIFFDLYGYNNKSDYYSDLVFNYINENNLNTIVKVFPYCENMNSIMKKYDIGLVCSNYEGFGLTTIEFMSNGLCVIGADRPATNELINNKINGLLYKFDDYKDLSDKIKYLIDNVFLMNNIAKQSFQYATDFFNIKTTCEKYHLVYLELINK